MTRRVFRLPPSPERLAREVDEELRFHIEGRIDELVASGWRRADAEAEARRRFGDYAMYRREARDIDLITHHGPAVCPKIQDNIVGGRITVPRLKRRHSG